MKLSHFIAPALALAGSAYWLSDQKGTIRELTEKTQIIKERVVIVEKATTEAAASLGSPKSGQQDEFTLPDGSLDWKLIAEMMAEAEGNGGMPTNLKAMLKLQSKMMELTEEELITGLTKIESLDLDPKAVQMIKEGLLSQLSEKNPIAALEALGDPITEQSGSLFWIQNQIISSAAKKDPAAAITWLDQKIAEGKLQSTSLNQHQDPRLNLEGALISQLISSDFAAAKSRLAGFNDFEKAFILSQNNRGLKGEKAIDYIKLTRESLPPEKASEAISSTLGGQYHRKLSGISEALSDLPLNESEKEAVIKNLVRNYSNNNESEDKFQEIYEWSKTEAPGQEAALVSNALNTNTWKDPQASFEKAYAVAESLGDEAILISFVTQFSGNGNERTIENQVKQFKDPEVAEQYRILAEAIPNELPASE